jgi:putative transposase
LSKCTFLLPASIRSGLWRSALRLLCPLLRNLARRLEQDAPGVAASILEGLDEMLTVNRLGLPTTLRRSLACTNSIKNMIGTVRRVRRNVKR